MASTTKQLGSIQSKLSLQSYASEKSSTSVVNSSYGSIFRAWKQQHDYRWATNNEYVLMALAASFTVNNMFKFVFIEGLDGPNFVHFFFCYLLVGYPMCYLCTFIGQYSQLGCASIRHILPFCHGMCYVFAIMSMLKCIGDAIFTADSMMYTLTAMQKVMPWMKCHQGYNYSVCWDTNSSCKANCISNAVVGSNYIYWRHVYLRGWSDRYDLYVRFGRPIAPRTVTLFITWVLVYVLVLKGIRGYKVVVRINLCITLALIAILLLACYATKGSGNVANNILNVPKESLISVKAWFYCVSDTSQLIGLTTVLHIVFGSKMRPNTKSDALVALPITFNFLLTQFASLLMEGVLSVIAYNANVSSANRKYIWKKGFIPFLTVMPHGLGFLAVPQIWSIISFVACILIYVNNTVTQLDAVVKTITSSHTKIVKYRTYVVSWLCLMGFFVGVVLLSKESYVLLRLIYFVVYPQAGMLGIVVFSISVCWVYGVSRISDDMHFTMGHQPLNIWKVCWYALPALFTATFVYIFFTDRWQFRKPLSYRWRNSLFTLFICPIPILAFYELFKAAKARNVMAIFSATERWGPPDSQERLQRRRFNPRKETRFKRRNDKCEHNCLLKSSVLKAVIKEEEKVRLEIMRGRARTLAL